MAATTVTDTHPVQGNMPPGLAKWRQRIQSFAQMKIYGFLSNIHFLLLVTPLLSLICASSDRSTSTSSYTSGVIVTHRDSENGGDTENGSKDEREERGGRDGQGKKGVGEFTLDAEADSGPLSAYIATTATTIPPLRVGPNETVLFVDRNTSHHIIRDKSLLTNVRPIPVPVKLRSGNGVFIHASERGDIRIGRITFSGAYFVPNFPANLLSVRKVAKNEGWRWEFSATGCQLFGPDGASRLRAQALGEHFLLHTSFPHIDPIRGKHALISWHEKCGHLNMAGVKRLGKSGRLGSGWEKNVGDEEQCVFCLQGKARRKNTGQGKIKATRPFESISVDLWGPASTAARDGSRYMLTVHDDFTSRIVVTFMPHKSGASKAVRDIIRWGENQQDSTCKVVRSDAGGEFLAGSLKDWFTGKGIAHIVIPPTDHSQNGRVERAHLTLANDIRTLLVASGLPPSFWAEAGKYSAQTRNHTLRQGAKDTPEDLWQHRRVDLSKLCAFGQAAVYRVTAQQSKLQPRGRLAVVVGYEPDASYYRLYDPKLRRIIISRDVTLLNTVGIKSLAETSLLPSAPPPQYDSPVVQMSEDNEDDADFEEINEEELDDLPAGRGEMMGVPPADGLLGERPADGRNYTWVEERAPPPGFQDRPVEIIELQDADRRYPTRAARLQEQAQVALLAAASADTIPKSYKEAMGSRESEHWSAAVQAELSNLEDNNTWDPVPIEMVPKGMKPLTGMWVLSRKIDPVTGKPALYKARFVARGCQQVKGRGYSEIFASVAHKDSIRMFVGKVKYRRMFCDQIDIVGALLKGKIDKLLFVVPPEGSDYPPGHVLRLNSSLYGLKQSPHLFNKALDQWLKSENFLPTLADPCVYIRDEGELYMMLSVHVDDQMIASTSRAELDSFKRRLNARFKCKDGGELHYFLGISIMRNMEERKLCLHQGHYIEQVLSRFEMKDCKPASLPFPSNFQPTKPTEAEWEEAKHLNYPAMAGAILYLSTITRPDLSYSANVLCRYIGKWSIHHYRAAKHLLRYIRGTSDLALTFDGDRGSGGLVGYADADWGGGSVRQPSTSLSTTQAEILASTSATRQVEFLRHLADGIGEKQTRPTPIYNDNQSAIILAKHPHDHSTNKHYDIRVAYIREKREDGVVSLNYIPTEINKADILTKSLSGPRTKDLATRLGLIPWTGGGRIEEEGSTAESRE